MTQFEPPRITASEDLAMPPSLHMPPDWEPPPGDALDELTARVARDLRAKEWVRGVFRGMDAPTRDAIVIWVDHIGRRDELPQEIEGYRVIVERHDPMEIQPA